MKKREIYIEKDLYQIIKYYIVKRMKKFKRKLDILESILTEKEKKVNKKEQENN